MGKYISRRNWKSKPKSIEPPSLGVGVLTRAKTLALRKSPAAAVSSAGSYIQLRSRRLVKPISPKKKRKRSCGNSNNNNNNNKLNPRKLRVVNSSMLKVDSVNSEGSIGENTLEIEATGRTTRETTPCSLIRNPDNINTPGSSTKSTTKSTRHAETKYRVLNTTSKPIPSTSEVDEFFMGPEKQQQQLFIEKYNFDPVNDKPLRGRYEWMKLDATKKC
ncbi:cyclin-dependent kinase inhibitor 4-like isoform X1 [Bidens hawaiensis]|uniref:cyclin-dependent kinase inhibitor 4-like isoform X1 n=1 Tax=Bidens hawaiensis TaxID=980011 RepID=UPI00404B4E9F